MRIATWNLERPRLKGIAKNTARVTQLKAVDADLFVLTETSSVIELPGFGSVASPAEAGYHSPGENYTTIHSRCPILRQLPTWNSLLSVCCEIESPLGPMLVYGTIITYANDRGVDRQSKRWVEHRKSIEAHREDWLRLRSAYPTHALVVAGDFNQSRDNSGWYGNTQSINALTMTFEKIGLRCLTEDNFRTKFKLERGNIDHICLSAPVADRGVSVGAWSGTANGIRMSDHNGVYVDVDA